MSQLFGPDKIYVSESTYTTDDDTGWNLWKVVPCLVLYSRVAFVDTTWTEATTSLWTTTHDPFGAGEQLTLTVSCAFDSDGGGEFVYTTFIVDNTASNPFLGCNKYTDAPLPDYWKLSWVVDSGSAEFRIAWYGAQST